MIDNFQLGSIQVLDIWFTCVDGIFSRGDTLNPIMYIRNARGQKGDDESTKLQGWELRGKRREHIIPRELLT